MADHLEFLRTVPGPVHALGAASLGPVPPLDPVPPRRVPAPPVHGAPDPVTAQKSELEKRLGTIATQRRAVVERMRRDHRLFIELEACASGLVDHLAQLERHRLAHGVEESGDGA